MKLTKIECEDLALSTNDAYSWDRYGDRYWRKVVDGLNDRGYDAQEIEAILRSKWMRWAIDMTAQCQRMTASKFFSVFDGPRMAGMLRRGQTLRDGIAELVRETFPAKG